MDIKLKQNQKMENVIFSVKELTNIYDYMVYDISDETIDYYVHDIVTATAQNNHNKLVEALNGFKVAIASQKNNQKIIKVINRLIDMLD